VSLETLFSRGGIFPRKKKKKKKKAIRLSRLLFIHSSALRTRYADLPFTADDSLLRECSIINSRAKLFRRFSSHTVAVPSALPPVRFSCFLAEESSPTR
jgi:hypothetical protein